MSPPRQNYTKPFSIRQYTLSCRQKNIFDCWPFPDKYLILCRRHGVTNVLPPIHHPPRIVIQSATKESNKNSREICHSAGISHDLSSDMLGSSKRQPLTTTTSHSCLHVDKQRISSSLDCSRTSWKNDRRRKGKQKKRWMVDILAVAKPCGLEDHVYEMNNGDRFLGVEKGYLRSGDKQAAIVDDRGCDGSELAEDCSNQKLKIHGYEEEYPNLFEQNRWILKGQIHRLQVQV